jgi:hypothetical protein
VIIQQQREEDSQAYRGKVTLAADATTDTLQNNGVSNLELSPEKCGKQVLHDTFYIQSLEVR